MPQCQCRRCQRLNTKSKQATSRLAINEKNQVKQSRPVCDQNGVKRTVQRTSEGKKTIKMGALRVETSGWRISIDIRESFPLEQSECDCFGFVNLWQEPLISTDNGQQVTILYLLFHSLQEELCSLLSSRLNPTSDNVCMCAPQNLNCWIDLQILWNSVAFRQVFIRQRC